MTPAASPAAPPAVVDDVAPAPRPRRPVWQMAVTAVLVLAAAVMDVLISQNLPAEVPGCPPDGAYLDCPHAMTALLVPGAAAIGAVFVWLVGTLARERRGGVALCWIAVLLAAAPAAFLVPGLVF